MPFAVKRLESKLRRGSKPRPTSIFDTWDNTDLTWDDINAPWDAGDAEDTWETNDTTWDESTQAWT